jgi:LmbE family N-acetylglucosaminyl deacetylase
MTPGDCGSPNQPPEVISQIRRAEGARAAALIGATYHCLEERDLSIFYHAEPLEKITRLLRKVSPDIVFTHSSSDYMLDHEMTSTLTRAACFNAPIPNFLIDARPVLEHIPTLYYCDPIEGKDPFGEDVPPSFCIDITSAIGLKAEMLASHESQREWLLKHHGMDQYVESMREWSRKRGQSVGVHYAEGFRQHLGHSYPQDNLLLNLLG